MTADVPPTLEAVGFPLEDLPQGSVRAPRLARPVLAFGALCVLLGAVLRLGRVGWREITGDEFTTLGLVGIPGFNNNGFWANLLQGRLPLYDAFISGLTSLTHATGEVGLRLPSAIFSLGACIVFLVLAGKYLRGTAFAIAAVAFSLNPILVRSATDATPHALLALLAVTSQLMAVRAIDEGQPRRWIRYGIVTVLGLATHMSFWALFAGQLLFAIRRPQRVPAAFHRFALFSLPILAALGLAIGLSARIHMGHRWSVAFPIDDALRNLVALAMGDFTRYPTNFFFHSVLYLFVFGSLAMAAVYHLRRRAEAALLPENVGYIDQTQDVVGAWRRLSLESFLAFNWYTFATPLLGVLVTGIVSDRFKVSPAALLTTLTPLAILVATGIDAIIDRRGRLAVAIVLLAIMSWYNTHSLQDRGLGVRGALKIVRRQGFQGGFDRLIYVDNQLLDAPMRYYGKDFRPIGFNAADTPRGIVDSQARLPEVTHNARRVFAIYLNDRRLVEKQLRAPVREYLNGEFIEKEKWDDLSTVEPIELRLYAAR